MKARELVQQLPTVTLTSSAAQAASLIATGRLPGIAVLDTENRPVAVLTASEVLRAVVPGPVQDDPSLAGVLDEASADRLCAQGLANKRVAELISPAEKRVQLASVKPDATAVECAAVMARLHSPLLVVLDNDRLLGVITATHLVEVVLKLAV
jgi:CBS domain-containing protein